MFGAVDGETGQFIVPRRAKPHYEVAKTRGVIPGIQLDDLAEAGWGVIFPEKVEPDIVSALAPLLELRMGQALGRFKTLTYKPNEAILDFFLRVNAPMGGQPVDPDRVPYYLLIVGSPRDIPLEFQSQLAIDYAIGRIYFDDLAGYSAYANAVSAYDNRPPKSKRLVVFGPDNGDPATALAQKDLIAPLGQKLSNPQWQVETCLGEAATLDALAGYMNRDAADIVFTGSHALCFRNAHRSQYHHQGALICSDWQFGTTILPEYCFNGLKAEAMQGPRGLISFHFACFSAGTPQRDSYSPQEAEPSWLAAEAFLARLPKVLLGHINGGALAFIGHLDLAWVHSFLEARTISQIAVFEAALLSMMDGVPVGHAMRHFNHRALAMADRFLCLQADDPDRELLWQTYRDARNYFIFADPAVRLGKA